MAQETVGHTQQNIGDSPVLFDGLLACSDCMIAIANDDYSGMTDAQAAKTRDGIDHWSQHGYLVIGDEYGFSWRGCDICRDGLGGDKHTVSVLNPRFNRSEVR